MLPVINSTTFTITSFHLPSCSPQNLPQKSRHHRNISSDHTHILMKTKIKQKKVFFKKKTHFFHKKPTICHYQLSFFFHFLASLTIFLCAYIETSFSCSTETMLVWYFSKTQFELQTSSDFRAHLITKYLPLWLMF